MFANPVHQRMLAKELEKIEGSPAKMRSDGTVGLVKQFSLCYYCLPLCISR